jgi:hypothetical protein
MNRLLAANILTNNYGSAIDEAFATEELAAAGGCPEVEAGHDAGANAATELGNFLCFASLLLILQLSHLMYS